MNRKILIDKKEAVIFSGYMFALGHSIIMTITFIAAYLHGNRVTVTINDFGEANIEIAFIAFTWILIAPGLYYLIKSMKPSVNTTKNEDVEIWSVNDLE